MCRFLADGDREVFGLQIVDGVAVAVDDADVERVSDDVDRFGERLVVLFLREGGGYREERQQDRYGAHERRVARGVCGGGNSSVRAAREPPLTLTLSPRSGERGLGTVSLSIVR